jgi:hypothetical protein
LLAALGTELHALVIDRDVRVHGDDGAVGGVQDFGAYLLVGAVGGDQRISAVSVPRGTIRRAAIRWRGRSAPAALCAGLGLSLTHYVDGWLRLLRDPFQ